MPLYSLRCWKRDGSGNENGLYGAWELQSEWTIEANGDDDARSQAIGFVGPTVASDQQYVSLIRDGGRPVWKAERD